MPKTETRNWPRAEKYLYEVKGNYEAIGAAGQIGLVIAIFPLVARFERGERTDELHDEIMALK